MFIKHASKHLKISVGVVISQSAICPELSEVAIEGELLQALVDGAHGPDEDVDGDLGGGAPEAGSEPHVVSGLLEEHVQRLRHLPARLLLVVHRHDTPLSPGLTGEYS